MRRPVSITPAASEVTDYPNPEACFGFTREDRQPLRELQMAIEARTGVVELSSRRRNDGMQRRLAS